MKHKRVRVGVDGGRQLKVSADFGTILLARELAVIRVNRGNRPEPAGPYTSGFRSVAVM